MNSELWHQALASACSSGAASAVIALLKMGPPEDFDPNRALRLPEPMWDPRSQTRRQEGLPLHRLAMAQGGEAAETKLAACQELLRLGADPMLKESERGDSALALIVKLGAGQGSMLSELIDQMQGRVKASWALEQMLDEGDYAQSLIRYLIHRDFKAFESLARASGMSLNQEDASGSFPLGHASSSESVGKLLAMGADPTRMDQQGRSALVSIESSIASEKDRELAKTMIADWCQKKVEQGSLETRVLTEVETGIRVSHAGRLTQAELKKAIKGAARKEYAKLRHPSTGNTPLIEALKHHRGSNASWLVMELGASPMERDARGVPAAAYALGLQSNGSAISAEELWSKAFEGKVDWSAKSDRGWPLAVEAADWAARAPILSWEWKRDRALFLARAIEKEKVSLEGLRDDQGRGVAEVYQAGLEACGRIEPGHQHKVDDGAINFARALDLAIPQAGQCDALALRLIVELEAQAATAPGRRAARGQSWVWARLESLSHPMSAARAPALTRSAQKIATSKGLKELIEEVAPKFFTPEMDALIEAAALEAQLSPKKKSLGGDRSPNQARL